MYKFILIVSVLLLITHIFYEPSVIGITALLLLIVLSIWKIKTVLIPKQNTNEKVIIIPVIMRYC